MGLYSSSKYQLCLDGVVVGCTEEDSVPHVSLSPCFQILCLFGNLSSKSRVKKERKSKLFVDIEFFLITEIKQQDWTCGEQI